MSPEERQLEKAMKFLELSQNDTLTPQELQKLLGILVEAIARVKEQFGTLSAEKLQEFQKFLDQAETKWTNFQAEKSQASTEATKAIAECRKICQEMITMKPKDGISPDPQEIVTEVSKMVEERLKPFIPQIEDIEKDLPKLGAPIRDALELLQGDERLDKSAIKGLDEWQKEIEAKSVKSGAPVMLGGAVGRDIIKRYDLPVDGLTSTFVLPAFWYIVDVRSSSSPIAFKYGTDWTNDATSITFTSEINPATTLDADQTVYIIYVTA